jgi:uncharacterized CHY-type Zn-finger protein
MKGTIVCSVCGEVLYIPDSSDCIVCPKCNNVINNPK